MTVVQDLASFVARTCYSDLSAAVRQAVSAVVDRPIKVGLGELVHQDLRGNIPHSTSV
jgi:hypothetical protein